MNYVNQRGVLSSHPLTHIHSGTAISGTLRHVKKHEPKAHQ